MDYMVYINQTLNFSWFSENIQYKNTCSNVGNIFHITFLTKNKNISKIKQDTLFNKWYKYPNKAHRLYWKLHPDEYPFK